jgi:aspartate/methionine/tyrosine aminotransferase
MLEPAAAPVAAAARPFSADALSRPHNPTGALNDARALEALAEVAECARIHVPVNEVYLDTLGGAPLTPARGRVRERGRWETDQR